VKPQKMRKKRMKKVNATALGLTPAFVCYSTNIHFTVAD
jgi:hypothetical protein